MPLILGWYDITLRLILTLFAGALLGFNRSVRGRPAGIRTTTLVCLAASLSMLQVNELLNLRGKAADSLVMLDLMRLPLGILTGMGFIGGGAILRRGTMVQGVTTAATLWLATVVGLCLGGGQLGLGLAGLTLGLGVLWGLQRPEQSLWEDRRGILTVATDATGPTDAKLREAVHAAGCSIISWDVVSRGEASGRRTVRCEVEWRGLPTLDRAPSFVEELIRQPGVRAVRWKTNWAP
jgi:putative Mg2+ transporter-C (MgtC) family protein